MGDVVALLETSEFVFEDLQQQQEVFLFTNLIDMVMNLRGTNHATVRDVKDNLKFTKFLVRDVEFQVIRRFEDAFGQLRMELQTRDSEREARERAAARSDDSDSDGDGERSVEEVEE